MKTGENSYTLLGTSHELEFFFFLSFKKGSSTSCLYLANLKGKLKWKKSDVHRWITDIFIWLVAYKDSWLFFSEGGWQSYTHTLLTSGILLLEIQTSPFLHTNPQPHQEKYTKLFRYTLFLLLFLSFELFPLISLSTNFST